MKRPEPVRVGDRFADSRGAEWRVLGTRPGGHVDLVADSRPRFISVYARTLRGGSWTRLRSGVSNG